MKVVISAISAGAGAQASRIFGRCPIFTFVDTDTLEYAAIENPAVSTCGGAGIQGAQFIVQCGAQAVITGDVGPNALNVLRAADIPVYRFGDGTVKEAVEAFQAGQLIVFAGASVPAHSGMPGRARVSSGRESESGPDAAAHTASSTDTPQITRYEEVTALKDTVRALKVQLAEVLEKLDRLEPGA